MNAVSLNSSSTIEIQLDPPAAIDAFFLFGIHKCGSSLLNKLFVDICRINQIPDVPIPELAFQQSIPTEAWDNCTDLNSTILDGYCHRGYRHFPLFLTKSNLLNKRKKILLVRDPRDAIVSAYFSFAKSHILPQSGELLDNMLKSRESLKNMELENYAVAQAPGVKAAFNRYHDYLNDDQLLRVYRYEDFIFEKESWIKDMVDYLGLTLKPAQIQRIAEKHNIIPATEDASQHIRKVAPGDHREKLSSKCIAQLNELLAEVLERYNYNH
jgi:hypothetical protein